MLTWLGLALAGIVLLNLASIAALAVAFGWRTWLEPKLARRRTRALLRRHPLDALES
jgi:hypothetical protein